MTSPGPSDEQQQAERAAHEHARRWDPDMVTFKPEELERRLRVGMDVIDLEGAKIGTVAAVYSPTTQDDSGTQLFELYLKVDRGLLSKDIYVPSRFIGGLEANKVRLTVPKSEIERLTWDRPEFIPD